MVIFQSPLPVRLLLLLRLLLHPLRPAPPPLSLSSRQSFFFIPSYLFFSNPQILTR